MLWKRPGSAQSLASGISLPLKRSCILCFSHQGFCKGNMVLAHTWNFTEVLWEGLYWWCRVGERNVPVLVPLFFSKDSLQGLEAVTQHVLCQFYKWSWAVLSFPLQLLFLEKPAHGVDREAGRGSAGKLYSSVLGIKAIRYSNAFAHSCPAIPLAITNAKQGHCPSAISWQCQLFLQSPSRG